MAKKSDSFYFGNFYACADCAYQAAHLLTGRMTEDEDGHGDTAMAQLGSLIDAGHGQVVRSQRLQGAGHLHRAVAVGVRLHHAQILHTGADLLPGHIVVVFQSIQVDFRPGAP